MTYFNHPCHWLLCLFFRYWKWLLFVYKLQQRFRTILLINMHRNWRQTRSSNFHTEYQISHKSSCQLIKNKHTLKEIHTCCMYSSKMLKLNYKHHLISNDFLSPLFLQWTQKIQHEFLRLMSYVLWLCQNLQVIYSFSF